MVPSLERIDVSRGDDPRAGGTVCGSGTPRRRYKALTHDHDVKPGEYWLEWLHHVQMWRVTDVELGIYRR
jgi:hypothetical protein